MMSKGLVISIVPDEPMVSDNLEKSPLKEFVSTIFGNECSDLYFEIKENSKMTNYCEKTSFCIKNENQKFLQDLVAIFIAHEHEDISFAPNWYKNLYQHDNVKPIGIDWDFSEDYLYIKSNHFIRISTFTFIIQSALVHYGIDMFVTFQIGFICSKAYSITYGGMGVFITKDTIDFYSTEDWVNSKIKEYQSKN